MHALKLSHIIIFQGCRSFSVCAREKVSNVFYRLKHRYISRDIILFKQRDTQSINVNLCYCMHNFYLKSLIIL